MDLDWKRLLIGIFVLLILIILVIIDKKMNIFPFL